MSCAVMYSVIAMLCFNVTFHNSVVVLASYRDSFVRESSPFSSNACDNFIVMRDLQTNTSTPLVRSSFWKVSRK